MHQRRFLSEGILIAATPVWAYACAYLRELAITNYFHVPPVFIHVGLESVAAALLFLAVAGILVYLGLMATPRREYTLVLRLVAYDLWWFILALTLSLFHVPLYALAIPVLIGIWLVTTTVRRALLGSKGSVWDRLRNAVEARDKAHPETLSFAVLDRVVSDGFDVTKLLRVYFFLIISFSLAYQVPGLLLRHQITYLVGTRQSDVVVLRGYGSNLLCARIDAATRQVRAVALIAATDTAYGMWVAKDIGPLKPLASSISP